jgi:hypothetical protein
MKSVISPGSIWFSAATYYAAWILLLTVGVLVYLPGLGGPFLFDDYGTLSALGDLGGVNDWATVKAYVLGGFTGPTGRPLSLLTFLIDGNDWPTDSWPFKRTNLVIHLVNGVLLGAVTAKILQLTGIEKVRSQWLALTCAALWLLHPFLVSTTLYAVQRMAQLSTLFIFVGIYWYLHGRSLLFKTPTKAYITMSFALGLCTLLAMISKENGILLPLLVLVLEFTIVASQGRRLPPLNRRWFALFLVAPSLVILFYLGYRVATINFFEFYSSRNFSPFERLLTESRILVDYLMHWFLPKIYTAGVFQDHFPKSTGFLSPLSTLLSIVFHLLLITVCIVRRHRWPLLAFGVLFFYSSHLLESTVLGLELYFEHRNYLAAAFLVLPAIVLLQEKANVPLFVIAVGTMMIVLAGFTRYTSDVWESYPKIVEASATKAPTSARAQQQYALNLYNDEKYDASLRVIDAAILNIPDDERLHILRSTVLCNVGVLTDTEFQKMAREVSGRAFDPRSLTLYSTLVRAVIDQRCPAVRLVSLRNLFTEMLNVPLNGDQHSLRYHYIKYIIGQVDIAMHEPARAVQNFRDSLVARPGASQAMHMAALMATYDYYDEALYFSEIALAELNAGKVGVFDTSKVSERDVIAFRENIRLEIESMSEIVESEKSVAE